MDRIKSRDATGGDDAKCEIYCEMECAELKLVWTEEMSEVRQRQVRFLAQVFRHNPLMYHTIRLLIRLHRPSARSHPAIFPTFYLKSAESRSDMDGSMSPTACYIVISDRSRHARGLSPCVKY